mgnify:CR=1 FL=1
MIKQAEIQKVAREAGVRDTQIEKDYVLTWILYGISQHELLSEALTFKGGTVLKKFYFEDYRYSEDLDFTLLEESKTNEDIETAFLEVFEFIKDEANMDLSMDDFDEHQTGNINFFINYIGPLGGRGKQVKVDISRNELLKFNLEEKHMIEVYSDQEECSLKCYSLNEVMTEKMRSLLSRVQPRDFYDLWFLSENESLEMADLLSEYEEKAVFKGLKPETIGKRLEKILPVFEKQWETSMSDQIQDLPPFKRVERELGRHFRKFLD